MAAKFEIKTSLKMGLYRHYKGGLYVVQAVGLHSETKENMVVYRNVEHGTLWIRPEIMFFETVTVDNQQVQRFSFIRDLDNGF